MALLVGLFGYLEIVLHGLVLVGQTVAIGSVLFLALLARPFTQDLTEGDEIVRRERAGRLPPSPTPGRLAHPARPLPTGVAAG